VEHRRRIADEDTTGPVNVVEAAVDVGAVDALVDGAGEASRASLPPQQAGSPRSTSEAASDRRRTGWTTLSPALATLSAWPARARFRHYGKLRAWHRSRSTGWQLGGQDVSRWRIAKK
jgi:hypothetical protein